MEHADQAGSLHREQVTSWRESAQQTNPGASELLSRQPAIEALEREVEERLQAPLRRELVKALGQQKIREALDAQEFHEVEEKVDS